MTTTRIICQIHHFITGSFISIYKTTKLSTGIRFAAFSDNDFKVKLGSLILEKKRDYYILRNLIPENHLLFTVAMLSFFILYRLRTASTLARSSILLNGFVI